MVHVSRLAQGCVFLWALSLCSGEGIKDYACLDCLKTGEQRMAARKLACTAGVCSKNLDQHDLSENEYKEGLRAMYIPSPFTMVNTALPDGGNICDSNETAVAECFDAENWMGGYAGVLFGNITRNLGIPVIAMTRANFSAEVSAVYTGGSSFTRCCFEISLGNVDVCASNFWETEERRGVTQFASPIFNDNFKIVSLPADPASMNKAFSIVDLFIPILAPFDGVLWLVMCVNFVVAGTLMWLLEAGTENEDYGDEWEGVGKPLGAAKGIYLSFMGFVCGSAIHVASVWPGRMVLLGFAYTTFLYVAAYQANLAAFMVGKFVPGALIDKFTDVETIAGGKICMLEAVASTVKLTYDWPDDKVKGLDDFGPMLETMYQGKKGCVGALLGKFEYMQYFEAQGGSFTYCDDPTDENQYSTCTAPVTTEPISIDLNCKCKDPTKNAVAKECITECPHVHRYCGMMTVDDIDFSLAIPVGFPVQGWIAEYISAWIVTFKLDGGVDSTLNEEIIPKFCKVCGTDLQMDACVNVTKEPAAPPEADGPAALGVNEMLGTYIVGAVFMFFGVFIRGIQWLLSKLPSKSKADATEDAGSDADANKEASAQIGFISAEDPMRQELDKMNESISAMLDKLKQIEANGKG